MRPRTPKPADKQRAFEARGPDHVTPAWLKRNHAWTDLMISELLGDPDRLEPNPMHPHGRPMRLYARTRVDAAMRSEQYAALKAQVAPRQAMARRGVATKTRQTVEHMQALPLELPQLSQEDLYLRAVAHAKATGHYKRRDPSPSEYDRLACNYLRHELSGYDTHLTELFRRTGRGQGYLALWATFVQQVSAAYPFLTAEANRQFEKRLRGDP